MHNKFISYEEIDNDMKQIEDMGDMLAQRLALLERNLVYMFVQIKECESKQEAEWCFECLDRIQLGFAVLEFKEGIGISDRLNRFMRDFDNFELAKEHYFEKIRSGEYVF